MIVIAIALEKELPPSIKNQYPKTWVRFTELQAGGYHNYSKQKLLIVITGFGEKSYAATQWICKHLKPNEIVNLGTCGSLTQAKQQWIQVNQSHCLYSDDSIASASIVLNERPLLPIPFHLLSNKKVQAKPLLSCQTIQTPNELIKHDLCDMELFYMGSVCNKYNIPLSSFKYVTDDHSMSKNDQFNESLPQFHQSLDYILTSILRTIKPTVSVVIPTLNRHTFINRAVQSVLNQKKAPNDIIIVDDGSLPPINVNNNTIHVIRNESTQGVSAARNTGIKVATSEWIAFLDSDDVWHPSHLTDLISYLNKHAWLRWAQSDETWIHSGRHINKKTYHQKPDGWGWKPSLERCLVSPSAVIIHSSMFDDFGAFDESLPVCEDYDLWLRFLRYRPIGLVKKKTMTKYAGHGDQLSFKYDAMDKFRVQSLIKQWQGESHKEFKQHLERIINKKLSILEGGALKRGLNNDAKHYQQLRETVNKNI